MEARVAERSQTTPDILVERVEGDEMYPEIQSGDLVQISPCDRIRGGGGTYLVEIDGVPMLQQVQRKPGRRLRLHSRHSAFSDVVIRKTDDGWVTEEGHETEFQVIGRYVGAVQSP
jgi:phage repressor protein C with HTH and peptisase S24 domain